MDLATRPSVTPCRSTVGIANHHGRRRHVGPQRRHHRAAARTCVVMQRVRSPRRSPTCVVQTTDDSQGISCSGWRSGTTHRNRRTRAIADDPADTAAPVRARASLDGRRACVHVRLRNGRAGREKGSCPSTLPERSAAHTCTSCDQRPTVALQTDAIVATTTEPSLVRWCLAAAETHRQDVIALQVARLAARLTPCTRQCGAALSLVLGPVPALAHRLPMHSATPAFHCWTRARLLPAGGGRGVGHQAALPSSCSVRTAQRSHVRSSIGTSLHVSIPSTKRRPQRV